MFVKADQVIWRQPLTGSENIKCLMGNLKTNLDLTANSKTRYWERSCRTTVLPISADISSFVVWSIGLCSWNHQIHPRTLEGTSAEADKQWRDWMVRWADLKPLQVNVWWTPKLWHTADEVVLLYMYNIFIYIFLILFNQQKHLLLWKPFEMHSWRGQRCGPVGESL